MTIERQWIEIMKIEVPDAFSPVIPFIPEVGFIDAQIKLMGMPRDSTWDVFLYKQFVTPVHQMFAYGASKVILAFDDYENVPRAKAITQSKRIARLTPLAFGAHETLPPFPPMPWAAAMGSRMFKARVVELIVTSLADRMHEIWPGQTSFVFAFAFDKIHLTFDAQKCPARPCSSTGVGQMHSSGRLERRDLRWWR